MDDSQKTATQVIPAQPQSVSVVSLPNKEVAPIAPFMSPSEVLPPKELREFGIDVVNQERPEIPPDVAQVGVSHSGVSMPAPTSHSNFQVLTKEEAVRLEKGSVTNSLTWFAKLIMKMLRKPQEQGGVA